MEMRLNESESEGDEGSFGVDAQLAQACSVYRMPFLPPKSWLRALLFVILSLLEREREGKTTTTGAGERISIKRAWGQKERKGMGGVSLKKGEAR